MLYVFGISMTNIPKSLNITTTADSFISPGSSKSFIPSSVSSSELPHSRPAATHCIFYNVIQDYLPVDESQWTPSNVPAPLNVRKGEVVQFVCTHENNTVVVKSRNKLGHGLVPLRCLSINLELTSISNMPSPKTSHSPIFESQISQRLSSEDLAQDPPSKSYSLSNSRLSSESSISNVSDSTNPMPKSFLANDCKVVSVAIKDNRMWYRVETTTSSQHKRFLCRYYQDFYQLHCQLLDEFRRLSLDRKHLPNLPKPMANSKSNESVHSRLNSLTAYLEVLLSSEHIPTDFKQSIFYDQWLCPKSGDLVQTPRGSLYKSIIIDEKGVSWNKILITDKNDSQDLVTELLHPDSTVNRSISRSSTPLGLSISTPSSPNISQPLQYTFSSKSMSQPSSPLLNKISSYSQINNIIKMKINFGSDCYAMKCQISDIETWDKFERIIRTRLIKDLPDPLCPFTVKVKDSTAEDKLIGLDAANFDIDNVMFMTQNQSNSNTNSYTQYNTTIPFANADSRRQFLKLNLEVSI